MSKVSSLKADTMIGASIQLLEMLGASRSGTVDAAAACSSLGLSDEQLDQVIDLICTLAHRESGARGTVARDGGLIVSKGDATKLRPVRLDPSESMVLAHLLHSLDLDDAAASRIASAALPLEPLDRNRETIGDTLTYGPFFQLLNIAIEDGVRCRISYRRAAESTLSDRVVDPSRLEVQNGAAYLVAWDTEQNAERRYRLDRIADASYTDDSIETHPFSDLDLRESLSSHGAAARISIKDERTAHSLTWAGLHMLHDQVDGPLQADLAYSSEDWLFEQVLAQAGAVTILDPQPLRERFIAYARALRI